MMDEKKGDKIGMIVMVFHLVLTKRNSAGKEVQMCVLLLLFVEPNSLRFPVTVDNDSEI